MEYLRSLKLFNLTFATVTASSLIVGCAGSASTDSAAATMPSPKMMSPTTVPAASQPTTAATAVAVPTGDLKAHLKAEYTANSTALAKALPDDVLTNPAKRAEVALTAVAILQQRLQIIDKLKDAKLLRSGPALQRQQEAMALLYLLRDPSTVSKIDAMAAGTDPSQQIEGAGLQLFAYWQGAGTDQAQLTLLADQLEKQDRANPDSGYLTMLTMNFSSSTDNEAMQNRLQSLVTTVKTDAYAKAQKRQFEMMAEAHTKLAALTDKPLTVSAQSIDGKAFSTEAWKGKVVLVDFWATWCPPCREGLPHLKEVYSKYHDEGLEIVGISNDQKLDALRDFTAKNGMPWPELFDQAAANAGEWHPLSNQYGVIGIPRMFLIDRKGICRSITARADMDTLVPKLLAEQTTTMSDGNP